MVTSEDIAELLATTRELVVDLHRQLTMLRETRDEALFVRNTAQRVRELSCRQRRERERERESALGDDFVVERWRAIPTIVDRSSSWMTRRSSFPNRSVL